MSEFQPNSQVQVSKPPDPKARPPLRRYNALRENRLPSKSFDCGSSVMEENSDELISSDDESDIDDADTSEEFYSYTSQSSKLKYASSARTSPVSLQVTRSYRSPNTSCALNAANSNSSLHKQSRKPTNENSFLKCILFICVLVPVLACFSFIIFSDTSVQKEEDDTKIDTKVGTKILDSSRVDKMLDTSMQIIQTRFYNQKSHIWNDISSAIYDIALYPNKPVVIMLFGNETDTLNCFARLLGQLSGTILGSNDYLSLTSKDFPDDVGLAIYKLKVHILQKRAVIVEDLLSINTEAIKAFHNFCDRENPLIGRAIYILTVVVDGYKSSQKEEEFVVQHITKKLLGKIERDILDPLVTRLTDGTIVPVFPESGASFNSANCAFPG